MHLKLHWAALFRARPDLSLLLANLSHEYTLGFPRHGSLTKWKLWKDMERRRPTMLHTNQLAQQDLVRYSTVGTRQYGNTIEWWIWHLPSRRKRLQPSSSLNQEMLNQIYNISKHSIRVQKFLLYVTVSLRFAWPFSPFPLPLELRFAGFESFFGAGTLVELRRAGAGVEPRPVPGCGVTWWTGGQHVVNGWRIGRKQVLTVDRLVDHCGWISVDGSLRYIHLVEDHKNGEYMRI